MSDYLGYYSKFQKPNLGEDYASNISEMQYSPQQMNSISDGGSAAGAGIAGSAASGAAMGGPAGAGIAVGGQLLSGYLAQKAADERQRRENSVKIAENQTAGETNAFKFLDNVYKGALR